MKYLLSLFLIASLILSSQKALAIVVQIDTVYADSIYYGKFGALSVADSTWALGKPDGYYARFLSSLSTLDLGFQTSHHNALLPIKGNSKIFVWGKTDKKDTNSLGQVVSAGQVVFYYFDGSSLKASSAVTIGDSMNVITVPYSQFGGWAYLELTLAPAAKSYSVDAVALLQDTTTPIVGVSLPTTPSANLLSYPNPFISSTTLRFTLEGEGETELVIIDALGKEVRRMSAGFQTSGMHEIPLELRTSGLYFVRLLINGEPVGTMLKIISE